MRETRLHHDHFTNPNTISTELRIEQHDGLRALLQEWEQQPAEIQFENKRYIQDLRKRTAQVRQYILHRMDARADPLMPKRAVLNERKKVLDVD